jgi:hypothetical protein
VKPAGFCCRLHLRTSRDCPIAVTRSPIPALSSAVAGGLAVVLLIVACTTNKLDIVTTNYIVSAPTTSFFKYGPAQEFGPDLTLTNGQHVTMLHKEFGYSRIMTDTGVSGYVSNDDIKALPPTPAPKPSPNPANKGFWSRHFGPPSNFKPSSDPLFDVNDVPPPPLPTSSGKPASTPAASPAPNFRY